MCLCFAYILFCILGILERLSKVLNRKVTSEQVWAHLKTMYNLKALDQLEPLPFPNEETNFSLPESEFSIKQHKASDDENESVKLTKAESDSTKYPKRTRGSLSTESKIKEAGKNTFIILPTIFLIH
jgi:hypothetical protein